MAKTYTCQCCGNTYEKNLDPEVYLRGNCFDCSFWLQKLEYPDAVTEIRAIIDGEHYLAFPETDCLIKGFGGRKFIIQFFDGRVIESHDLWHQGTIPDQFREMLPDNAVFLPEEPPVITDDKSGIPF